MRLLGGRDARVLLPGAALFGAILLCLCDTLARSVRPPLELPVGIVTALLGVPLFLFLARHS
jgi:iron complex transport system permease protein